ncbi:MAG: hypothetical protein HYZ14_05065 [Bacteroidetes bacterium]|nr:hypothetical protein [Bacteroidota bacterium]
MRKTLQKKYLILYLLISGGAAFGQQMPATAVNGNTTGPQSGSVIVYENQSTTGNTNTPAKPSITGLPGFPVFVNTGDPVADDARYEAAKVAWYAENKKLVKKFYRQN